MCAFFDLMKAAHEYAIMPSYIELFRDSIMGWKWRVQTAEYTISSSQSESGIQTDHVFKTDLFNIHMKSQKWVFDPTP